jgi:hypothetical protein
VCNTSTLNVSGSSILFQANVLTANITSGNVLTANVTSLNVSGTAFLSNANVLTANISTGNIVSLNVTGDANIANLRIASNLITNNIIMASNLSTNSGFGNVYLTGNLVVNGNIFSSGGSVGSGSGTSQGVLFTYAASNTLPAAFATGTAGPGIAGYHLNLTGFTPEATQSVTQFTYNSGMLKFTTAGLYQVTCVIAGDQPAVKVAVGKTSSATFPPVVTATAGYDYVYNYPTGASPSHVVTLPLTVTDTSVYYYLDVFLSTVAGTPSVLYPTRSTTAAGSAYGTYIQVAPFGNYLTSATGVASALLANCVGSSNLSGVYSSNAYRLTLTSANGWTVNGTSTSLAVTANGNFQVNQTGIYEVNLCLNAVGNTPVQFQVGSLASDTLAPGTTTPAYLFSYAPMYTQDPTTAIQLPLNITNVANVYFVECSFPGTVTGNVALSNVSTFVSIKPIGGYISTGTDPWIQQGTSVYYNGGPVGIGGVIPTSLTETLTVNGNTSFVGNVTVTSDASGNAYVLADRVPTGSLHVSSYVTGSVPLTTTTNLIQNYLSNAASIRSNTSTGTITQALYVPGGSYSNTGVNFGNGHSLRFSNLAASNLFMETWVNLAGIGRFQNIINRSIPGGVDFGIYIHSGNYIVFQVSNATTTVTAQTGSLTAGPWVHLAASYHRTSATQGTLYAFVNGAASTAVPFGSPTGSQPVFSSTANIYLFHDNNSTAYFSGNVADVRVMTGSIVPVATFTPQSAPFTTAPTYRTGMDTGYTSNLTLALNSQYFPGASTSPYGPCLTLPGTVGSYYSQSTTALNTPLNSGFTIEAWVNYASLANSSATSGTIFKASPTSSPAAYDWFLGPSSTTGQFTFLWSAAYGTNYSLTTSGTITTGSWNHIVCQANNTGYVNMFINGQIQTLTATGFSGSGTAVALNISVPANQYSGITVGQYNNVQGPNFALAKARVLFGANTYTTTTFTPSPNLGAIPAGGTVAWSLDTQYPLPTYPSIQDVTPIALQASAYGAVPTPIGGVTSNVLSPYSTTYPQLDSIRFDGTGYIDYGNAASSVLTTNLWANAWTIEGWVYLNSYPNTPVFVREPYTTNSGSDFAVGLNSSGVPYINSNGGVLIIAGTAIPLSTWTHLAITYDGAKSNIYQGTSGTSSTVASATPSGSNMIYTPTSNFRIGGSVSAGQIVGNLADVRVSNVARYTGSTYTVPNVADGSAPFVTDRNTLLLLKSLAGQTGTTLEVQGRGLNAVSLGATRSVQSYPPAPMSSYLLDTTSNASVTYGQGKYVASASSEYFNGAYPVWAAFDKSTSLSAIYGGGTIYSYWTNGSQLYSATTGLYTGPLTTVDTLGNAYLGEWLQLQVPVSTLLSNYVMSVRSDYVHQSPSKFWILGSRDGLNWTLMDSRSGISWASATQTFTVGATQAYNLFRVVVNSTTNGLGTANFMTILEWTLNGTEESLCVTNDSKVGVGIANPQRALEVAGDLVVSGTISGGAGMGAFRNRIINGDMRIAQRGTSSTTVGYATVDRWGSSSSVSGGTITQSQQTLVAADTPYQMGFRNSLRYTVTTPLTGVAYEYQQQVIEGYNVSDLNWGTSFGTPITVSFWFRSNAPTGSTMCSSIVPVGSGVNGRFTFNFTLNSSGTWQYVTATIPPPPTALGAMVGGTAAALVLHIHSMYVTYLTSTPGSWETGAAVYNIGSTGAYQWWNNAGNYIEFTGVQLERGTVATGFEQRPFATELALCQRYYYQWSSAISGSYGAFGFGVQSGFNQLNFIVQYPVTMRSNLNSTANFSNSAMSTFQLNSGGGAPGTLNSFAFQTDSSTPHTGRFVINTGSAGTAGLSIEIRANNTTTAFLGFSAEL